MAFICPGWLPASLPPGPGDAGIRNRDRPWSIAWATELSSRCEVAPKPAACDADASMRVIADGGLSPRYAALHPFSLVKPECVLCRRPADVGDLVPAAGGHVRRLGDAEGAEQVHLLAQGVQVAVHLAAQALPGVDVAIRQVARDRRRLR